MAVLRRSEEATQLPPETTPVLIAGGGPVGLATAIELSLHGVASVVIEPRRTVSWLRPRAKTTSSRTMEHFRRWGMAAAVRQRAMLPQAWSDEAVFCTTLLGREVTRFDRCFGLDLIDDDLVSEGGQQIAQPLVEQIMRETVTASPVAALVTGWTVTALAQDDDGASAWVADDTGVARLLRAEYVVGCDGARSVIRKAIGSRLEGSADSRPNFNIVFRSDPLAALVPHGAAVHYWILNPDHPGVVGRLDLAGTWWCIAAGVPAEQGEADPVSLVRNLIGDERASVPIEIVATDPWRARMLLATTYGEGRVFLAGDSAHQNPPWGGHGFNTGVGDAVNIGWKLAAVLNGWAPPALLGSYEAERRPVAADTIAVAAQNMATLAPELADPRLSGSDDEFESARAAVAAVIQRTKDGEFHSLGLVLGTSYAASPIVATEQGDSVGSAAQDSAYHPSAAPGHRLPHHWVGAGRSLFDLLGPGYTLVGDLASPGASQILTAAAHLGLPVATVELARAHSQSWFEAPLVLVRPDQHVAWRGTVADDAEHLLHLVTGNVRAEVPGRAAVIADTGQILT